MSELISESVIPEDYDCKPPQHLIIWLDTHIGDPEKYHKLKKAFSSNIDPRSQTWTMLNDQAFDILLRTGEAISVSFGGILCLLVAYTDSDACYEAFERYKDRRILFITSGSLGEHIVPRIIENFRQVFTDSVTNKPYNSIYIFCGDISRHLTWAEKFYEYIQMFDHEANLLLRMTRDMAEYYSTHGEREYLSQHLEESLRFYRWSKKLFLQYEKLGQPCQKRIAEVETKLNEVEQALRLSKSENEKEENSSEPCG